MKKLFSIILAAIITISVFPMSVLANTSGDYEYEVLSEADKTCVITAYTGKTRELTIPAYLDGYKVVELGRLSFLEAKLLKTVKIPATVRVIGESAFFNCVDLTTVSIPYGVEVIRQSAFEGCSNLGTINFPDSITFIGRRVLYDTLYMPEIVEEREELVPEETESPVDTTDWPQGALYIGKHLIAVDLKKSGSFTIASGTKTIAGEAFYWCSKITSVTIPDSVVTIGEYAFYNCDGLTRVTLPESVTTIARAAFDLCDKLQSINIPSGVKEIGDWAFTGCKALKSVTIPGTVEKIGTGAYCACTALTTVKVNSGVKEIGTAAFQGCTALSSITVADSVTKIGQIAFGATKYYKTSTNWKNNALYIGNHLIGVKGSVSGTYAVKDGTKAISQDAFYECTSVTDIEIPASVTGIMPGAFRKCSSLEKINVASGNNSFSSVDGVLYSKDKAELICCPVANTQSVVTVENNTKVISDYAFYECKNVKEVKLSKNLETIGEYAFYNCDSLKTVKCPASLAHIDEWAFVTAEKPTFMVVQGSYAEQYADENGFPYEYSGICLENSASGVTVETEAQGVLPATSELAVSKTVSEDETTYLINIVNNGEAVQPNGKVTVRISVSEIGSRDKYKVYHVAEGNRTELDAIYENGYLVFDTTVSGEFVVVLEKAKGILGDANGDGVVSSIDARRALQVAAEIREATPEEFERMDVNGDGAITSIDARKILQIAAEIITV